MEKGKQLILIPLIIALFGVAMYLDSQGCKSLAEAYDILSGEKARRVAYEQEMETRHQTEIQRERQRILRERRLAEQNRNTYTVSRNISRNNVSGGSINSARYASNIANYRSKSKIYSDEELAILSEYRNEPNEYFTNIWRKWQLNPELSDADMVVIRFVVGRDGQILSKKVESSASEHLTKNLVKQINDYKFKPLPKEYAKQTMTFDYRFTKKTHSRRSY